MESTNPTGDKATPPLLGGLTRVVVVGAGPAGLLAAIHLLRRNRDGAARTNYQVTLLDPGVDYGQLDEAGLSKRRSWMIGLSSHGLTAIREVPGLYSDYVEPLGAMVRQATFAVGSLKFTSQVDAAASGFCVDRNYVCGALARYIHENFGQDPLYISHYNTKALFVDPDNKRLLIRPTGNPQEKPRTLEYDVLLGCDGIRSIVRNAFLTVHRDFEFDLQGNFGVYKSTHLTLPVEAGGAGQFMFLIHSLPNVTSFVLPERGRKLNVTFGWSLDHAADVDPALLSDDVAVVEAYAKRHFKAFPMDCQEFAQQWVGQDFQTTQMVHCNFYHSLKLRALLLGDAAHATVPNIGQGMNTALEDATVLKRLLEQHHDDWDCILPAFSQERVKEGNALTELSFHTFSLDGGMMVWIILCQNVHRLLNRILPTWLLEKEPMMEIVYGMKLSVAYDKMVQYGYMAKSRQKNQDIKRAYFEKKVGMVQERRSLGLSSKLVMAAAVAAVGYGVALWRGRSRIH